MGIAVGARPGFVGGIASAVVELVLGHGGSSRITERGHCGALTRKEHGDTTYYCEEMKLK